MKWLDNEQTYSVRNESTAISEITGFVVKSRFLYTKLDCHNDWIKVLHAFVPNKSLGQLLAISPESFIFLKTLNSEFSNIEGWFMVINFC